MASVRYTFTLDPVKDVGVIKWLDSQPNTSAAIRAALEAYIERPTHADIGARLDEILNAIQTARWVTPISEPDQVPQGEPTAAVKGFEKVLQKFGG